MKKINWNFLYIVLPILLVAGLGAVFVNLTEEYDGKARYQRLHDEYAEELKHNFKEI